MDIERVVEKITEEVYNRLAEPNAGSTGSADKQRLEYAMFSPNAKVEDIRHICQKAKTENLSCVGVPQWFVAFAKTLLEDTNICICTPLSLPGGAAATAAKYAEVKEAVKNGAGEIAVPINMEMLKANKIEEAKNDFLDAMLPALGKAKVKAVVEFGSLSDRDIENAVAIAESGNADYFVISNILSGNRASVEDVKKVRVKCSKISVKVLGGVQDEREAQILLDAGADAVTLTSK